MLPLKISLMMHDSLLSVDCKLWASPGERWVMHGHAYWLTVEQRVSHVCSGSYMLLGIFLADAVVEEEVCAVGPLNFLQGDHSSPGQPAVQVAGLRNTQRHEEQAQILDGCRCKPGWRQHASLQACEVNGQSAKSLDAATCRVLSLLPILHLQDMAAH